MLTFSHLLTLPPATPLVRPAPARRFPAHTAQAGWKYVKGSGCVDWLYFRPGAPSLSKGAVKNVHYFEDLVAVRSFVHTHHVDGVARRGHVEEGPVAPRGDKFGSRTSPTGAERSARAPAQSLVEAGHASTGGTPAVSSAAAASAPASESISPDVEGLLPRSRTEWDNANLEDEDLLSMDWGKLWRRLRALGWTVGSPPAEHGSGPKSKHDGFLAPVAAQGAPLFFDTQDDVRRYVGGYPDIILMSWPSLWTELQRVGWRRIPVPELPGGGVYCAPFADLDGVEGVEWFRHKAEVRVHLMRYPELSLDTSNLIKVIRKTGWKHKSHSSPLKNWLYKPPGGDWNGRIGQDVFDDEDDLHRFIVQHPSITRPGVTLADVLVAEEATNQATSQGESAFTEARTAAVRQEGPGDAAQDESSASRPDVEEDYAQLDGFDLDMGSFDEVWPDNALRVLGCCCLAPGLCLSRHGTGTDCDSSGAECATLTPHTVSADPPCTARGPRGRRRGHTRGLVAARRRAAASQRLPRRCERISRPGMEYGTG